MKNLRFLGGLNWVHAYNKVPTCILDTCSILRYDESSLNPSNCKIYVGFEAVINHNTSIVVGGDFYGL